MLNCCKALKCVNCNEIIVPFMMYANYLSEFDRKFETE